MSLNDIAVGYEKREEAGLKLGPALEFQEVLSKISCI